MAEMKADNVFKLKKSALRSHRQMYIYGCPRETRWALMVPEVCWSLSDCQHRTEVYICSQYSSLEIAQAALLDHTHWLPVVCSRCLFHKGQLSTCTARRPIYCVCTYMNVHILLKGQSWAQIQVAYKYDRPRYTHIYLIMFMLGQSILTAVYLVNWKYSE